MKSYAAHLAAKELLWCPAKGVGWINCEAHHPKHDYFDEYVALEDSDIGKALTQFRVDLVTHKTWGRCLDIGVGSGAFVRAHRRCSGYDVDPKAVRWLEARAAFCNPYLDDLTEFDAVTFWDSLEHITEPERLLERIGGQLVFVSLPIFRDLPHLLKSKHNKPAEHRWYFTVAGFRRFMEHNGFGRIGGNFGETDLGREDIGTFIFQRGSTP